MAESVFIAGLFVLAAQGAGGDRHASRTTRRKREIYSAEAAKHG